MILFRRIISKEQTNQRVSKLIYPGPKTPHQDVRGGDEDDKDEDDDDTVGPAPVRVSVSILERNLPPSSQFFIHLGGRCWLSSSSSSSLADVVGQPSTAVWQTYICALLQQDGKRFFGKHFHSNSNSRPAVNNEQDKYLHPQRRVRETLCCWVGLEGSALAEVHRGGTGQVVIRRGVPHHHFLFDLWFSLRGIQLSWAGLMDFYSLWQEKNDNDYVFALLIQQYGIERLSLHLKIKLLRKFSYILFI